MKKTILLLAILFPIVANAMKIATDEIDEFTDQRTVITSWETIAKYTFHIRFRLQNGRTFVDFKYCSQRPIVIEKSDKLLFKATDGEIGKFESIATYTSGIGDGATGLSGSKDWGISATYKGDVEWFTNHTAKLVRLYGSDGYNDVKLSEADGNKVKALAVLFVSTIGNAPSAQSQVISCTVDYLSKKKKSNKWDVVESEFLEYIIYEDLEKKANEWRAKTDDTYDYEVKITREKLR